MTINLPITPELLAIAAKVVWFKSPQDTLANPIHFMAYLMTYGVIEDLKIVKKYLTIEDFREALAQAPPGIIDPRSWNYWHIICDQTPVPARPVRFNTNLN